MVSVKPQGGPVDWPVSFQFKLFVCVWVRVGVMTSRLFTWAGNPPSLLMVRVWGGDMPILCICGQKMFLVPFPKAIGTTAYHSFIVVKKSRFPLRINFAPSPHWSQCPHLTSSVPASLHELLAWSAGSPRVVSNQGIINLVYFHWVLRCIYLCNWNPYYYRLSVSPPPPDS